MTLTIWKKCYWRVGATVTRTKHTQADYRSIWLTTDMKINKKINIFQYQMNNSNLIDPWSDSNPRFPAATFRFCIIEAIFFGTYFAHFLAPSACTNCRLSQLSLPNDVSTFGDDGAASAGSWFTFSKISIIQAEELSELKIPVLRPSCLTSFLEAWFCLRLWFFFGDLVRIKKTLNNMWVLCRL